MKRFIMSALIALTVAAATFATTWQIDIADSKNGTSMPMMKDQYATDYKVQPPVDVTSFFNVADIKPGDTIEVYYNFVAEKDVPWLKVMVIDNAEKAKWWTEIAGDYTQGIADIKKGATTKGVITFKVVKTPIQNVTVQLMCDDPINNRFTVTKTPGVKTGKK